MAHPIARRVVLASAAFGIIRPAVAAERIIRLGHTQTDASHYGLGSRAFAAEVAKHPDLVGFRVSHHPNAELGDELVMVKNITKGLLDMAIISNSVLGNLVPELGLLNAPFLFPSVEAARATLDGPVGQMMIARAAAKDLPILTWGANGLRHITANKAIRTPADLLGLKIRVPQSEVMTRGMRALGAEAGPLSFTLLREALRTGQFQAQENPVVIIESQKLNELQTTLSLTGHCYDACAFAVSPDLLDDLSPTQRQALQECAVTGADVTRRASAVAQKEGLARLEAAGMTVVRDVAHGAFSAAIQPWYRGLEGSYDKSLLDALKRSAAA